MNRQPRNKRCNHIVNGRRCNSKCSKKAHRFCHKHHILWLKNTGHLKKQNDKINRKGNRKGNRRGNPENKPRTVKVERRKRKRNLPPRLIKLCQEIIDRARTNKKNPRIAPVPVTPQVAPQVAPAPTPTPAPAPAPAPVAAQPKKEIKPYFTDLIWGTGMLTIQYQLDIRKQLQFLRKIFNS